MVLCFTLFDDDADLNEQQQLYEFAEPFLFILFFSPYFCFLSGGGS